MKKILFIGMCIFFLGTICFSAQWTNSLKPKGEQKVFKASNKGVATSVILIPNSPLATETKAAEELKKWFKEISGIDFDIVNEKDMQKNKKIISVGNTLFSKNAKLGKLSDGIKPEGYAIIGKDGDLFLIGGTRRGPLFAVYALLEEDLGVRWYTRKGENKIPKGKDLILKYVSRQFNPVFDTRFPGIGEVYDNYEFCLRNRINPWFTSDIPDELGGSTKSWCVCHTSFFMIPPEKYFDSHPEYFSLIKGKRVPLQLCYSNPDVVRLLTEKTREILRTGNYTNIAISPQDGDPLCDCDKCNLLDKPEGSKSATFITALNKICDSIRDEFPNRKIITLAYLDYYDPPKTIVPDKNIIVLVCSDSHDWHFPLCNYNETDKYRNGVEKWVNVGAETLSWNYVVDYGHIPLPLPNMLVVSQNIKLLRDYGVKGVFLQSFTHSTGLGVDSGPMRAWVWGKQLWNPDFDTKKLMKDFVYGYYGNSADNIWKYQELLLSIWEKNHKKPHNVRTPPYTSKADNPLMIWDRGLLYDPIEPLYNGNFIPKAMVYLDEAKKKADTPEILDRVNLMRVQMLYLIIGRGIGYFDSNGQFFRSEETKKGDKINFPYYLGILDELEATCKKENIITFRESDAADVPMKIKKWRDILINNTEEYPFVDANLEWNFTTVPDNSGEEKGYLNSDYNFNNWKKIKINSSWETQGYPNYDGFAWYNTTQNITGNMLNEKYILMYFSAVDEEAWIYINGKLAFEHSVNSTGKQAEKLWDMPFLFDAKPFLTEGDNKITIKVHDKAFAGGIYMPIYFLPYGKIIDAEQVKALL